MGLLLPETTVVGVGWLPNRYASVASYLRFQQNRMELRLLGGHSMGGSYRLCRLLRWRRLPMGGAEIQPNITALLDDSLRCDYFGNRKYCPESYWLEEGMARVCLSAESFV